MGADGSFTEAPLRPEAPLSEPSLLVAALFSNTAAGTAIALLVSTLLWSRRSQLGFSRRWSSHGADSFEHLHYHVDNFFSQSPYAKGLLLLVITALLVMVGGFMLWISGAGEDASLFSSMWSAWRFVTDGGEYDEGVGPRLVGLVLVLSGMLFFALLVGLIGESIQEKIDSLKHGKGRVLESNHTLVLGWSDKFLHLAREIGKANESEGGGVLVVLCDSKTKQEISTIQQRVLERILHARNYSSVLVLASEDHETNASESDSCALTTLLLVRDVRCTMAQQQGYDPLRHGLTHSASDPGLNGGRTARGAPDRATGGALSRAQVDEVLGPLTLLGEILHSETRDLVAASGVGDYIMSNQLLSKVVAMVAENASVGPLFDTLFSEEGQGIHVRDARAYVGEGEELSFWELGARARADGDVLIGLKLGGDEAVLNPADKRTRRTWQRGDFVIVLSNH